MLINCSVCIPRLHASFALWCFVCLFLFFFLSSVEEQERPTQRRAQMRHENDASRRKWGIATNEATKMRYVVIILPCGCSCNLRQPLVGVRHWHLYYTLFFFFSILILFILTLRRFSPVGHLLPLKALTDPFFPSSSLPTISPPCSLFPICALFIFSAYMLRIQFLIMAVYLIVHPAIA